jgi:hypothetical protein
MFSLALAVLDVICEINCYRQAEKGLYDCKATYRTKTNGGAEKIGSFIDVILN